MAFLWIVSCLAFVSAAYGCGVPAIPPQVSVRPYRQRRGGRPSLLALAGVSSANQRLPLLWRISDQRELGGHRRSL
ncbi:unnamed protein product [Tetraodon nigroviridis]|uniref:(spotted green pufferfish) hypothetical protein n=1 Tax=Tetraodon nigroviridis TaxID=99883 RepID=Q4TDB1_TETNG|nr:unnamed protein product [Tetraodon nigroviridis]